MLWRPPSSVLRPSRRDVLALGAATGAGLLAPKRAKASVSAADRKYIFVLACGGWDPTRALADGFDNKIVAMEANAERASANGIDYVSCPSRPSVDAFFDAYGARTAVVHGLLVPSIAHEACFILFLTGSSSDSASDWPAILGASALDRYVAPTLVLGGPTFPGDMLPAVVQTGGSGQLSDIINGDYTSWTGVEREQLTIASHQKVDAYVRRRAAAYAASTRSAPAQVMGDAFETAIEQASGLKDNRQLRFSNIAVLADSFRIGVDALSLGLSRCVMVAEPVTGERAFDSHTGNDSAQDYMWEDTFSQLMTLMFLLDATPGVVAETLAEETTVVVYSEMGRTPWLNGAAGKDHWPYTSVMLIGSGVQGGRSVGAYDSGWYGATVDYATGDLTDSGKRITCGSLGATLLAMGDVDPGPYTTEEPITGLMAD
jgi:uncharacterized protein (DUF1501 family)